MRLPWKSRHHDVVAEYIEVVDKQDTASPQKPTISLEESRTLRLGEFGKEVKLKLTQDGWDLKVHLYKGSNDFEFTIEEWRQLELLVHQGRWLLSQS